MNKFKKLRTKRNLTQQASADLAGVNLRLWQRWESGEYAPSMKNLIKISSAFKISVDEIIKK